MAIWLGWALVVLAYQAFAPARLPLAVALTSGAALGFPRYVIAIPAPFLVPARLGRSPAFDRTWSLASILGLAVYGLAFSADFWAG